MMPGSATMSGIPKVTVAPDRVTVRPGESIGVEVTIQNTSQAVEHYGASIVGLPGDNLFNCEPSVVKLRPGESGAVQVNISIPERPAPDAGLYTLGVLVRSPYQRQVSRCEELRMDLQPAPSLSIDAHPEVITGGPDATYTVRVANEGNTIVAVSLSGTDQERKVSFAFRPRSVQIAPNSSAPATVTVKARAPWTGQEVRRTLTVRASAPPDLAAERNLTFVQRPRVPGGPMKVAGIAAAVLVLAGATVGAALLNKAHDKPAPNVTISLPPPPPGMSLAPVPPGTGPSAPAPQGGTGGKPGQGATAGGGGGGAAGKPVTLDFTKRPNGEPAGDNFLPPNAYPGVTLTADPQYAGPDCANATGVALRTVAGVGAFLTSTSGVYVGSCNTLPVIIAFNSPAKQINLTYASNGTPYRIRVQLVGGQMQDAILTKPAGQLVTVPYPVQGAPQGAIAAVTFSHASTDPKDPNPTIIKSLTYWPA
jgi:hypothetical protein